MPRLRREFGAAPERFRLPGGWTIPLGAFIVSGLLLLQIRLDAVLVTAVFLVTGGALYWLVRRRARQDQ